MKELGVEIYKDVASPAVSEVGKVAGRSAKALLAPLRGFLWCWEKIEEYVEKEVQKRLEKVPDEQKKSPDPEIAVPLLQSLTYTAQNETLREMYIALLANSMDKSKEKVVHPSYVEIIKKMNRLDALVFEELCKAGPGYVRALNPRVTVSNSTKYITSAVPEWYLGWTIEGYNEFDVSASLVRMSKFGIVDLVFDDAVSGANYRELIDSPFLQAAMEVQRKLFPNDQLVLKTKKSAVYVNEYGRQFRAACR